MRNPRRESGRFIIVVAVLVALSAGAVYWKRVVDAPDKAFQEGLEAYQLNAFGQAVAAFQEATELGHPEAGRYLGELYLEGRGVERNHRRAFELFEASAEAGHAGSQFELARLYQQGRGTAPDMEKAVVWYWSAARNELPEAQLELGRLYESGQGVDRDLSEAARWYTAAAEAGLGEAQQAIGLLHHEGRGVDQDYTKAAHWLLRAAEDADLPEAWFVIGTYHENGQGGYTKDLSQAVWCYEKAAKDFHTEGLYRAGMMKLKGRGTDVDAWAAVTHFRQAAAQGHEDAMYRLGVAFERGEGARESRSQAEEWYGKAAAAGHLEAMTALQAMGLSRMELSRYEQRRLEQKREEFRARKADEQARKLAQLGRCEVYGSDGPVVEMRTRMDCLNRGGSFKESDGDASGSFSTVDPERDWDVQRRELNRRQAAELRKSRSTGYSANRSSSEPLETDWVACYSRGSRGADGHASYGCSTPMRKRRDMDTSWCRERGYDSRRLFKHESSARQWYSNNCR